MYARPAFCVTIFSTLVVLLRKTGEQSSPMNSIASVASQRFPHVCRTDKKVRGPVNFLLFAVSGLFLSLTALYLGGILDYRGHLRGLFLLDLIVAGVVLFMGSGYNKRAILREDSIEVTGWFRSRKLHFSEIRGRQTIASSGGLLTHAQVLVPHDHSKRKLGLPIYLHMDQFFLDWYDALPEVPLKVRVLK